MGFHFPPYIERLRQQSNLELEYQLPPDGNVVALPLGWARDAAATGVYPDRANSIPLTAMEPRPRQERSMPKRIRIEVFATAPRHRTLSEKSAGDSCLLSTHYFLPTSRDEPGADLRQRYEP
jgi:hypothetical protein